MWVWREETVRGGWRLDSYGSWTYDEPARLERVGSPRPRDPEPDDLTRERFAREQRAREERMRPALSAVPAPSDFDATPIFRSVAHEARTSHDDRPRGDRRRRRHEDADEGRYDERYGRRYDDRSEDRYEDRRRRAEPAIPEPHPGSGPFPAQGRGRRGLAPVEAVPPPAYGEEPRSGASPEDEMRRRAERRRRPRVEPDSGRHVLRR